MSKVKERIEKVRKYMKRQNLEALIFTSSDPHMSEYVAPRWRARAWFSGFTGSAGVLVVTQQKAGLWTDFRYWIQAKEELEDSGIDLFKEGLSGTVPFVDWTASELKAGDRAGIEGATAPAALAIKWVERLAKRDITLVEAGDIPDDLWPERPAPPTSELYTLPPEISGKDRKDKIDEIRELLTIHDARGTFLSSLDDIAWLLNIRAMDVKMNPVALAYCWVGEDVVILFTDESRFRNGTAKELAGDNIQVRPYDSYVDFLKETTGVVYLCRDRNSWAVDQLLSDDCEVVSGPELTALPKSRKNLVEIDCFHKAMAEDGAAMAGFIHWLKKNIGKEAITELSAAEKVGEFRRQQPDFVDDSFTPIPGYGPHGALCHYSADEESSSTLEPRGLFLLDSGGQYRGATTDITRTISLGEPTELEKSDYTLVLKGHVALSRAVFPEGTRGYQLDLLARQPQWDRKMNYGHGTGHGVGAFLNVHEGPHSISPRAIDIPIKSGTVTSNEPGIYREGVHGIRIENLLLTVESEENEFGAFLNFETLTLCPYERDLIDRELLTREEKKWINSYHKKVFTILSPLVDSETELWLREACAPL